jgi:hypothetical protein
MGKVEELPDELTSMSLGSSTPMAAPTPTDLLDGAAANLPYPMNPNAAPVPASDPLAPNLPPAMAATQSYTSDEMANMLNRVPLFMTTLDETDGEGGENIELEALRALAYEGTRAEVAGNFRENGNEAAKEKRWADARGFYDKALDALKVEREKYSAPEGDIDMELVETDPQEEDAKERKIEEACYVNRALCHLEIGKLSIIDIVAQQKE